VQHIGVYKKYLFAKYTQKLVHHNEAPENTATNYLHFNCSDYHTK